MSDNRSDPANSDLQDFSSQQRIACSKCASVKVAKSQPRKLDNIVMRLLPRRPYRCLHCYHRFWVYEAFFASQQRVISWLVLLLMLALAIVFQMRPSNIVDTSNNFSGFGTPANNATTGTSTQPEPEASTATNTNTLNSFDQPRQESQSIAPQSETTASSARPSDTATNDPEKLLEKDLSPAQLDQRLQRAKAEAELAMRENQRKKELLRQSMLADKAELESLLKIDIGFRIDQWREAWQLGRTEEYLSYYSPDFKPRPTVSREQWAELRRQRVYPGNDIEIVLSNFSVSFNDDHTVSTVIFDQDYKSGSHANKMRKQLILQKNQQEWHIVSETKVSESTQ